MERRNFIKSFGAVLAAPSILAQIEIEEPYREVRLIELATPLDHRAKEMSANEVLRMFFETGVLICKSNQNVKRRNY